MVGLSDTDGISRMNMIIIGGEPATADMQIDSISLVQKQKPKKNVADTWMLILSEHSSC